MANVVEVILRAKDDVAGVNRFRQSLLSVKSLIAGIAVGISFQSIVDNIVEAERATAKLDAAFKSTGATVGLTRDQLDDLATSLQSTTTVSSGLVKEAESILLAFDKIRGQAFERTIKVAADLSARLGTDLTQNVRTLGLALQDPENGFTRLTRAGIKLDDSQVSLIKQFQSVGNVVGAQNVILSALEKTYGGAATAARDTLGGALTGLKNAFGDLFEGTKQGTQGATDAINALSTMLTSPELKDSINHIVTGLATAVRLAGEFAIGLKILLTGKGGNPLVDIDVDVERAEKRKRYLEGQIKSATIIGDQNKLSDLRAELAETNKELDGFLKKRDELFNPPAAKAFPTLKDSPPPKKITDGISFINPQTQAELRDNFEWLEEFSRENDRLRESTRTATEQVSADYNEMIADIKKALDRGLIDEAQANAKRAEALSEANEKFLAIYKHSQKEIAKENDELAAIMKGAWEEVGRSIQNTLSDIFYTGDFSLRSLRDAVKRILADMLAAIVTSGIKQAIQDQFTGGGGGNSGLFQSIFNVVGRLFGGGGAYGGTGAGGGTVPSSVGSMYAADGGRATGLTLVGEEGPELVDMGDGAQVYNSRHIAFASAGKQLVTFAPVTHINVAGNANDETITRLVQVFDYRMQKRFAEFQRSMSLNGYEVRT